MTDHDTLRDKERKKNGKSSAGKIELISYLSGDNICIEVKDDGRGIDRDMLISKAIQKGILTSKDIKNKENILDIVFIKGLTTVKSITLVSGRGIGLDIVKENIDAVGGIVKVSSIKRKGTIFTFGSTPHIFATRSEYNPAQFIKKSHETVPFVVSINKFSHTCR